MKRLGVICTIIVGIALGSAARAGEPGDEVRVLTRNLYVGADIFRVVDVDPDFLLQEIAAVYLTVVATDFPARAEALADEILATDPHLIGLQEVSLIRTQTPGDFLFGNPIAAMDVEYDFLQILLDALAARGLSYQVAAVIENADVELPLVITGLDDVRLTDRDVILARSDVPTSNALEQNFDNFAALDLSGVIVAFKRGFVAVDAQVNGRPYRFVNTHLETGGSFGAATQSLQAPELIEALSAEFLPVILLGDFNSSPQAPPERPYQQLIDAGFIDTWLSFLPQETGYTCCHNETVDNPVPNLDSRIDLVFVRNAATPAVNVVAADVLGDEIGDQTPGGLWPSDHAGVYAALTIPVADNDGDGFDDLSDNCITAFNPDQRDTDTDGFGNLCDADFNQDFVVNFADLAYMRIHYLMTDPDADLDGDGIVNAADLAIMKDLFYGQPGPGAPAPD